uniref:Protein kinase domain-containing protein n=1 Tax=Romanomermis culicivorax TaxID=13658 RepID=A0A915HXN3_ROMCU
MFKSVLPCRPIVDNNDNNSKDVFVLPKLVYDSVRFKYLRVGELLGKGGFASCYAATDCGDGQKFALKIVPKSRLLKEKEMRKVMYEIHLQFALIHPYIVKMWSAFDDNCNVYMLLEYCQKRFLQFLISMNVFLNRKPGNKIGEKSAAHFMRQIVQGVQFLHDDVKILHRDLKLGNLLLCDDFSYYYSDEEKDKSGNKLII